MYQYTHQEKQFLQQRADQFDRQVQRYKLGRIDEDNFKQLRLRNGLYLQRHAHMLRVAIPYGQLNSCQLSKLADIATQYDRGYGHFTTRQNIQFNWPELDDVPAILRDLASVEMHAIQTSGSCIRNITSDPLAGIAPDEFEDPRPWCELIRQWSTLHPEFYWLPRKFKFAVSGALEDRAAIRFHDIGIQIVKPMPHAVRFQIYVGGGLGRTPVIGKLIRDDLKGEELLGYLQAILRVYNQYGRRDHQYRSRIKILVNDLGIGVFQNKVEAEWHHSQLTGPVITPEQIALMKSRFAKTLTGDTAPSSAPCAPPDPRFELWQKQNTQPHAVSGYAIVHVSLKAPGQAPGDITSQQMGALATLARDHSEDEIRATHEQNLVLPHVKRSQLKFVWQTLQRYQLATPNIGLLTDMIACPGLDFCSLANAGTISLAKAIGALIEQYDRHHDIGPVQLKMSGCMNACGHHHVGHIGILGVDKKGEEWYQVTLGGHANNQGRLGERLGPAIPKADVPGVVRTLIETYVALRHTQETFLDTVIRVGITPFKDKVYANHQKSPNHRQSVAIEVQ